MGYLTQYDPSVLPPEAYEIVAWAAARLQASPHVSEHLGAGAVHTNDFPEPPESNEPWTRIVARIPSGIATGDPALHIIYQPFEIVAQAVDMPVDGWDPRAALSALGSLFIRTFKGQRPSFTYADVLGPIDFWSMPFDVYYRDQAGAFECIWRFRVPLGPIPAPLLADAAVPEDPDDPEPDPVVDPEPGWNSDPGNAALSTRKALVIGIGASNLGHDKLVKAYFDLEAPETWSSAIAQVGGGSVSYEDPDVVTVPPSMADAVQYAIDNSYGIIIHSYIPDPDLETAFRAAFAQGLMIFHAHGSNSLVELSYPPSPGPAVWVGGEDPGDGLVDDRSYGPGLELDGITRSGETAESWAAPTVAAHYARAWETCAGNALSRFEAWALLRRMAGSYADGWDAGRGFGLVAIDTAIPALPADALEPPVAIRAAVDGTTAQLTWFNFRLPAAASVRITHNTEGQIYNGTDNAFDWDPYVPGQLTFEMIDGLGGVSAVGYATLTLS